MPSITTLSRSSANGLNKTFTKQDAIILDSFAGSGDNRPRCPRTKQGGWRHRKFILVECEDYAHDIRQNASAGSSMVSPTLVDTSLRED